MEEISMKKYHKLLKLQGVASARNDVKGLTPFKVEDFCAQVAWMGRQCPVYPWAVTHPDDVCKFLILPEYKDYRCPALIPVTDIFAPVFERGTAEQRKALEKLADISVMHNLTPLHRLPEDILETNLDNALGDAIHIYNGLGLKEKARLAEWLWGEITGNHYPE